MIQRNGRRPAAGVGKVGDLVGYRCDVGCRAARLLVSCWALAVVTVVSAAPPPVSAPVQEPRPSTDEQVTVGDRSSSEPQVAEASVNPGINDRFVDPELSVDEWVARFEVESREVFTARDAIVAQLALRPGDRVADIGAGTGLFTRLFADALVESGWVYAVDISPKFIQHLRGPATEVGNITPVLATERDVCLPPASVDVAFICDTYHHFEYPRSTLASILRALKPQGRLFVIDFEKIPGKSSEWVMGHVRAGKSTFRDEIEAAGFRCVGQRDIDALSENYMLEFRRPK